MSRTNTARNAGGLFFPQSKSLGIDRSDYSPNVQAKIVFAGVTARSFAEAETMLQTLTERTVSAKQVERVTERIGAERVAERDEATAQYESLPLVERKAAPEALQPPALAVVMPDGGRLQLRPEVEALSSTEVAEDTESDDEPLRGYWREDQIGLIISMKSTQAEIDPCPEIPKTFVDQQHIVQLTRQLKPVTGATEAEVTTAHGQGESKEEDPIWEPPQVEHREVLATRRGWAAFGSQLAQAAWARGFYQAERRAFVGDGARSNWTLWRNRFSSFTPILDFIHALTYVFAAAQAGRTFPQGWKWYVRWITLIWQGQVATVIAELAERQAELGPPTAEDGDGSVRRIVARSLTYLQNNQERMRYADYRRQGLPITSSHIESTIKQINHRVKGSEKFWSTMGSETVLQLRADLLSDSRPLDAFWQARQNRSTGQRPYRKVA
jgi:hypothetical protein